LVLEELHRFDNPSTRLPGGWHWDILGLYREIVVGIKKAVQRFETIASLGIDTWAVDYGLFDGKGNLLGLPYQYRDPRTEGVSERMEVLVDVAEQYRQTGVMPFFLNTSTQLLAEKERGGAALLAAESLLLIPDLLAYWLTGRKAVERTNASTTQLFNPVKGDWAWPVIEALGLPKRIFGEVINPGTVVGNLRPDLVEELGVSFPIIATASHDTASAVAGIPGDSDSAFLSSGTWCIIGAELPKPILSDEARDAGFANEQGVEGTTRFLKNVSGLWLVQECRREWQAQGEEYSWQELADLAAAAESFTAFVDPDDEAFSSPGKMPEKIVRFCRESGQPVPTQKGTILRVATESIAMKHSIRLRQLRELTGMNLPAIRMGGGGIRNQLLVQCLADACAVPVHTGPLEATACGNLITQMTATGDLASIAEGRELIAKSLPRETCAPRDPAAWEEPMGRFQSLLTTK
jgi:sugar (pentulose or hexulose) kinase